MEITELNIENFPALLEYLRVKGRLPPEATAACRALSGGVSNRTVLVECEEGTSFVVKQALDRLRVATEWRSDPRRIEREAAGLHWLPKLAGQDSFTRLLFVDEAHHLLAMEAVPQPHWNWKELLLSGVIEEKHVLAFARLLGRIHSASLDRPEVAAVFDERTFFETLRLEPYYAFAGTRVPEASSFLSSLAKETRGHRLALVHGDYSPKNVLIHEDRLVLLDHEVIHFGDPAFDVGFSLTHFLSKAHHLPQHRIALLGASQRYWRTYSDSATNVRSTDGFEERVVRHTWACLLARVAGRSPLEYLNPIERDRQRQTVIRLIEQTLPTVPLAIETFGRLLD